ncbi:MAG: hypothetical protein HDR87_08250 [Bacteroides sp.]|nr:hypothetical protein [Bacteroides sp.]
MSYIENLRVGDKIISREMWDTNDIAEYCNLDDDDAEQLHILANSECGIVGYGDIPKTKFLRFLNMVREAEESRQLQDEANAATIVYAQKNYNLSRFSFWVTQAIALLSNH